MGIPQSLLFDGGKYPLASSTWDEEERQAILEVIDSGRYTMGEKVSLFETAFADYIGTRFAVMVNSGSSAKVQIAAANSFGLPGATGMPERVDSITSRITPSIAKTTGLAAAM